MRKHRLQQGIALIELALSIPLMIMLSMMVIEFGRAMYEYNTVTKSVRDAVRYLTVQLPPAPTSCPPEATNLVRYGLTSQASTPLAPGLVSATINCTWQTNGTYPQISTTVTVTVSGYRFKSMVSNVFGLQLSDKNGGINFGNIAATMRMPT
ncbi:pilus assembly protein [Comamonas sp. NyZ500]|jgi:Flp pilus assembly protein TadG|uniref:TadE/TadG family type IV pilus assembly protein n=1 Tax=Comamonas TaxID=283 RepID=UPI00192C4F63|nr:TadE/TadG family type IV pilus assembly protein [Comamonas sp. NyZ500]MBL5976070.1 pilus assembly protein [Comamonas sp. NyZ500]